MRIAFFTDTYLPNMDGVVTSMLNLIKEYESRGHEVFIHTSGTKSDKEKYQNSKTYYHSSIKFPPYPTYKVAVFPFFSVSNLREHKIDIVHSHALSTMGLAAIAAARKLKIPCIETFHTNVASGTHYLSQNKQIQDFGEDMVWRYINWFSKQFDELTCPSQYTKESLSLHNINATVVPNSIDTDKFIPLQMMQNEEKEETLRLMDNYIKKFKITNNTLFVVSRHVKEKNLDLAIRAMPNILQHVKDAKLLIAGAGPDTERLKDMTKKLNLDKNVTFTGFIPHDHLKAIYPACKTFVFPSGPFETHGLVALESLASGLPVVGMKNSAVAEMITPTTGELASNSPESFAEATLKILGNTSHYNGCRKFAEQFSNDKIADKFLEIYSKHLKNTEK